MEWGGGGGALALPIQMYCMITVVAEAIGMILNSGCTVVFQYFNAVIEEPGAMVESTRAVR